MEKSPSENEFEKLIQSHREIWLRRAKSILRDSDLAEEVLQETLLRVWENHRPTKIRKLSNYVSRAVFWNSLKKISNRSRLETLDGKVDSNPDSAIEERYLDALDLESALTEIPISHATVIRLKFYLGLSFREIAQRLSISTNTASSRSRYAINKLKKILVSNKKGNYNE